jgi:hypothetical protein
MELLQILPDIQQTNEFGLFEKLSQKFFVRLLIDIVAVGILVRWIYFRIYRSTEFFFTFFIFNLIIFLITFLLNKVEMSLGAAFGLFAVFSMLRYRTEGISMKDMTYLFLVIAMGLITAIGKGNWDELSLLNFIILGFTYLLESNLLLKREEFRQIQYDKPELLKPEYSAELKTDLEARTGLKINRISVSKVDFLRDTAQIKIHYFRESR